MNANPFTACPQCDLLLKTAKVAIGVKARCPRCQYLLYRPRLHSIERTFTLSLSGLILFIPANLLPLVGIKLLGNNKDGTIWTGVESLYLEGMWGLAILVFLASMLFPLLKIILSLLISSFLLFNHFSSKLVLWMRYLKHLDEWAMLEVYTLGIIVACVKLESMAELRFGYGLYAFVGLLIITGLLTSNLDDYLFWQRIAQLEKISQDKDQTLQKSS